MKKKLSGTLATSLVVSPLQTIVLAEDVSEIQAIDINAEDLLQSADVMMNENSEGNIIEDLGENTVDQVIMKEDKKKSYFFRVCYEKGIV